MLKALTKPASMAALFLAFATACSSGQQKPASEGGGANDKPYEPSKEPVELTMLGSVTRERFKEGDGARLQKKFPHITINYFLLGTKDDASNGQLSLEGVMATGTPIDIIGVGLSNLGKQLIDNKLAYDIGELIKTHRYDLNQLYPQSIAVQKAVTGGPLYGLPVNRSAHKIYYNKDLFDKFGVPYPHDKMTWDETYELAKKMTRQESGVQYQGAIIDYRHMMLVNQLSIGMVDPKSNKALFATEPKWQRFVSNLVRFQQIPGNEGNNANTFIRDGRAAMYIAATDLNSTWTGLNWDIAKAPTFPDLPGVGSSIQGSVFAVTSLSKHKDQAFDVIAYLASEESMLEMARSGGLSVLDSPKVKDVFGENMTWLNGRKINFDAMFPDKLADPYTPTPYDADAQAALVKEMNKLAARQVPDVNTALRQAAEEADKAIAAQLGK